MERHCGLLGTAASVAFLAAFFVDGESLGQAAARERARRAAAGTEAPRLARKYTNADLPSHGNHQTLTAWVRGLHYPSATDLETTRREAEADLESMHYRRAIQKVHPGGVLPDRVDRVEASARPGDGANGFESGVVVDAQVWVSLRETDTEGTSSMGGASAPQERSTDPPVSRTPDPGGESKKEAPAGSKRATYNMPCNKETLPTCAVCVEFQMGTHDFARTVGRKMCAERGSPTLVSVRSLSCTETSSGPNPVYEATCAP